MAQPQPLLGTDDNPLLTMPEARFLDSLLRDKRQNFTFAHKRIAFLSGSSGTVIETKSRVFKHHILPWTSEGATPVLQLVPLTEAEKQASGGYDALLMSWAKLQLGPVRKQRMIRELGQAARAGAVR
ncbi:hypothetical protein DLM85_00950 [Hymenobacter edaphi]|uniref:DUF8192 domain-containing protein n=2 Tax=Hymenobacter edaphi TaxID=2211146 RepID=A0A328BQV8_9BACT|nr:hypothetical protein DLM85_00950 [Hymenobacter edaphi]